MDRDGGFYQSSSLDVHLMGESFGVPGGGPGNADAGGLGYPGTNLEHIYRTKEVPHLRGADVIQSSRGPVTSSDSWHTRTQRWR